MDWSGTWIRRNFTQAMFKIVPLLPKKVHKALLPGDYVFSEFLEVNLIPHFLDWHFTDCQCSL